MKNKSYTVLLLGVSLFSTTIGLFIGAFKTPVAGLFITGILGFFVGIAGVLYGKKTEDSKVENDEITKKSALLVFFESRLLGKILCLFSIFLVTGSYIGSIYRRSSTNMKGELIWTLQNKPKTIHEALDWINVTQILLEGGYTLNQIREVYQIRQNENKNDKSTDYDVEYPYYKMLEQKSYNNDEMIDTDPLKAILPNY